MDQHREGLYEKYEVRRKDGRTAHGEKHALCCFFVLDLDCDPHSTAAIRAYADSCEADYPLLARDLRNIAKNPPTSA